MDTHRCLQRSGNWKSCRLRRILSTSRKDYIESCWEDGRLTEEAKRIDSHKHLLLIAETNDAKQALSAVKSMTNKEKSNTDKRTLTTGPCTYVAGLRLRHLFKCMLQTAQEWTVIFLRNGCQKTAWVHKRPAIQRIRSSMNRSSKKSWEMRSSISCSTVPQTN